MDLLRLLPWILIVVVSSAAPPEREETPRAAVGSSADAHYGFSFIAALYYLNEAYPFCTGVVIGKQWVLSTRTCMDKKLKDVKPGTKDRDEFASLQVVIGAHHSIPNRFNFSRQGDAYKMRIQIAWAANVFYATNEDIMAEFHDNHAIYKPDLGNGLVGYTLDFAVIKLLQEFSIGKYVSSLIISLFQGTYFDWSKIKKLWEAWHAKKEILGKCTLAGWGFELKNYPNDTRTVRLESMDVIFVDDGDCAVAHCVNYTAENMFLLDRGELCFKSMELGDACEGDGGGALFCDWFPARFLAMLITPAGCDSRSVPSVYRLIWTSFRFVNRVMGIK